MQRALPSRITVCLAAVLAALAGVANPAERVGEAKSPDSELVPLLEHLEHSDFTVREEASRRLLAAGPKAIPTLTKVASAGPPEAATRVLHVLESHLLSDDRSEYAPADDALMSLADGDQGFVALSAAGILSRHRLLREQRAVVAIRELGGKIQYDLDRNDSSNFGGGPARGPDGQIPWPALRPSVIVISRDWKGGTEGLKFLRHLSHWEGLIVYVIRGSDVPLAEAEKLAASMPGLMVHERGAAYLGVASAAGWDSDTCVVGSVIDDGPAGRAGLRKGDIIRELDGRIVTKFDDLIEKLKDHAAGERVPMTIDRHNFRTWERLTIEVELGKWALPDYTESALEAIHRAEALQSSSNEDADDPRNEPAPINVFPPDER